MRCIFHNSLVIWFWLPRNDPSSRRSSFVLARVVVLVHWGINFPPKKHDWIIMYMNWDLVHTLWVDMKNSWLESLNLCFLSFSCNLLFRRMAVIIGLPWASKKDKTSHVVTLPKKPSRSKHTYHTGPDMTSFVRKRWFEKVIKFAKF